MMSSKPATTLSVSYRRPFSARTLRKFFVSSEADPPSLEMRSLSPAVFSELPRVGLARKVETSGLEAMMDLIDCRSLSTWLSAFGEDFRAALYSAPAYFPASPGGVMGGCGGSVVVVAVVVVVVVAALGARQHRRRSRGRGTNERFGVGFL